MNNGLENRTAFRASGSRLFRGLLPALVLLPLLLFSGFGFERGSIQLNSGAAFAQTPPADAKSILQKTLDRDYQDLTLVVHLVKVSKSGRERPMDLEVKIKKDKGLSKTLAVFTGPPEVKGIRSLSWDYDDPARDPDRWFKLAGMEYVKCRGKACKKMEERFGFSMDIFGLKVEEADHELLGEETIDGHECWKIKSVPRFPERYDEAYLITWVDKEMFAARRIEAYAEDGSLISRSEFTGFQKIGDHYWETRGEVAYPGKRKKVRFEIKEAKMNTGLPDELFKPPKSFKVEE